MTYLLGVDLGTSSVRSAIVDPNEARIVALAAKEYPLYRPQVNFVEQLPLDWWTATIETIQEVVAQSGIKDIAAISLSGQMHGTVLFDSAGKIVCPAIIWADQRSSDSLQTLLDTIGEEEYAAKTGTLPASGFMGASLVWLQQNRPDILRQVAHVLLPKDFIRFMMTGEIHTDLSDAAGTGIFDIHSGRWAWEIIEKVKLPTSIFPEVLQSFDHAGELQYNVAKLVGLEAGIPIIVGCADQAAQALGNGIIEEGVGSVTVGSGGQVFLPINPIANEILPTDRRVHVFNHATGGYYVLGATLSAGLSLRWLRDLFAMPKNNTSYQTLSNEAAAIPAGADGLVFLPYLNGERTPHMDTNARGGFIGLTAHHTRGHMARAIMEGVAYSLKQALEICEQVCRPVDRLIASGGGFESPIWRQIFTDVFDRPLYQSKQREQAVFGAAMLAGAGIKYFAPQGTTTENFVILQTRLAHYDEPILPEHVAYYTERYHHFCELYPRLKTDFHYLG